MSELNETLPSADVPNLGGEQAITGSSGGPFLLMSGYSGANTSPNRGYLYWPSQDPRRELSPMAAQEIRRRVHFLCANFGFARRLVHGMAKLIGVLTPYPVTPDENWNSAAFENFQSRAGSPELYDRAGKFDFFTAQLQTNRMRFRDGYGLGLLTESDSTNAAQIAFYEAAQLGTPRSEEGNPRFIDGARMDRFGKHIGYGLRDPERPENVIEVEARDSIYFGSWESHGSVHPASVLAHAVLNMSDVQETRQFWKQGIKDYSRTGLVVEKAPNVKLGGGAAGFGGGMMVQTEVEQADGSKQKINWEQVMNGGVTPQLKPGQSVKVVTDGRPSPENQQFEEALLRDCAWGVDLPFEALCKIAGLTGPGVRYVMAEIERWVLNQHYNQGFQARKYFAYHTAKEIKAGRLAETHHPYWRQVEMIGQPSMTIDRGREERQTIVKLESGLTTWADEISGQGAYWKNKIRQRIREVAWAKAQVPEIASEAGIDLEFGEVFPAFASVPSAGSAEAPDQVSMIDELKADSDMYGVAVRAGRITPQQEDEAAFRNRAGMPPMSSNAKRAWSEDKGTRRPITLTQTGEDDLGGAPPPEPEE